MHKTILLLETVSNDAMQLLVTAPDTRIIEGYDYPDLTKVISQHPINAIITRGKGQVQKELMDLCPHLTVVARCGVGLDNIDVDEATKRNIYVVNAPNSNANTIAEHTIALLLLLQRNLYNAISMVKENHWMDRASYKGDEVFGKTLGILGMGNIGQKVASIASAMGMNVIYWSNTKKNLPYPFMPLDELLSLADIISLHLPLTPSTNGLLNAAAFSKMKPTSLIINTARGKIIDEKALASALENKWIAGFAADVLSEEPPQPKDPLLQLPNVFVTPHVGSLTKTTYNEMCVLTVQNTLAILNGKAPSKNSIFNREALQNRR